MKYRIVLRSKLPARVKRLVVPLIWIFGGGALVGVVFVFAFLTAMRVEMRGSEVEVPVLTGLTLEAARERAGPVDLVLEVVDQRNDPRVASGLVLEQMPRPGASVRRGRKMKLIISLGGKLLRVPDFVGHAAGKVAVELRQQGLTPGDEGHVYSYLSGAGKVLAQVPPSETTVVPRSRVYRLVSDGPPPATWVMPELVGRTLQEVERWISFCGFRRGTVRRAAGGGRPSGTVISQLPQVGYPIRSKDIVDLVIAE